MQCESCGHHLSEAEVGASASRCPACGNLIQDRASPWAAPGVANPEKARGYEGGIPWENESSAQAMLETVKGVLFDPTATFGRAAQRQSISAALIYCLALGMLGGVISTVWQTLLGASLTSALSGMSGADPSLGAMVGSSSIVGIFMVPVSVLVGTFLMSGIVHLALMMFGGAEEGFEATFRAYAFATGSTAIFQVVPIVGGFVSVIWGLVAAIMGITAMQRVESWKAALAVLLPLFLCCFCLGVGGVLMASSISSFR